MTLRTPSPRTPDRPAPGAISTETGSIVAGATDRGPGVGIVDSDSRRPGAAGTGTTRGRGRAMAAMGFAQSVDNDESSLINTFFPLIAAAFSIGEGALGIMSSISRFARMLFGPFWAMLADRFGRKKILIIVTGGWGIWTVAAGFAPNYGVLLTLYCISVVGTVASEPINNGLLPDLFKQSERGRAYGTIRAIAVGLGIFLGPAIGLFAAGDDPNPNAWRFAMWTMGGVSMLSGLLIALWVKEPSRNSAREAMMAEAGRFRITDGLRLFKIPTVALMAGMLPLVTSLILGAFYPNFLVTERGVSIFGATIVASCQAVGAVLSAFLGGRLADFFVRRFGEKGRVILMQLTLVAYAGSVALATQLQYDGMVAAILVSIPLGLVGGIAFAGCVLPMVSNVVPTQLSATAFAMLFSLIQGGITALLVLVAGFIAQAFTSESMFLLFVVLPYLANALYWFLFYRVYPKDVEKQEERTRLVAAGEF